MAAAICASEGARQPSRDRTRYTHSAAHKKAKRDEVQVNKRIGGRRAVRCVTCCALFLRAPPSVRRPGRNCSIHQALLVGKWITERAENAASAVPGAVPVRLARSLSSIDCNCFTGCLAGHKLLSRRFSFFFLVLSHPSSSVLNHKRSLSSPSGSGFSAHAASPAVNVTQRQAGVHQRIVLAFSIRFNLAIRASLCLPAIICNLNLKHFGLRGVRRCKPEQKAKSVEK